MLQPGHRIPPFTALTTEGTTLSNVDIEDSNVVFFFYPADNTSGCTREACDFRDARSLFDADNVVVLGVSGDDQASHRDFTDRYGLNFPLLVDVDGDLCRAFGVPRDGTRPRRVTFLADHTGVVRRVWDTVQVIGHAHEVHEAVREIAAPERDTK